jgi:hypothetical protein
MTSIRFVDSQPNRVEQMLPVPFNGSGSAKCVTSSSRNHDDGGIGRNEGVQALVVTLGIVMLNEGLDLPFEVTGKEVVFQVDAVLQYLVPAFYLSLGLRVERGAAHMVHPTISRPLHWDEPRPIAVLSSPSARQFMAAAPLREMECRKISPFTNHQAVIY